MDAEYADGLFPHRLRDPLLKSLDLGTRQAEREFEPFDLCRYLVRIERAFFNGQTAPLEQVYFSDSKSRRCGDTTDHSVH